MAKVLCVLYDDPVGGYPKSYPGDDIPKITRYPDGQSTPTPENIDFRPGTLLGSVSGALGLRPYLEQQGHEFVVTSDKDGPDSLFEREITPRPWLSWPRRPCRRQGDPYRCTEQRERQLRARNNGPDPRGLAHCQVSTGNTSATTVENR